MSPGRDIFTDFGIKIYYSCKLLGGGTKVDFQLYAKQVRMLAFVHLVSQKSVGNIPLQDKARSHEIACSTRPLKMLDGQ
jgi:hypothetical protein